MTFSRRSLFGAVVALIPLPAFAGKAKYIYDALGRVTGVLYADGALAVYEYDAAGNRTILKNPYVGPTITADCFDAQYYLRSNPDVAAAGVDPYSHFMNYGWKEDRNPNSFFSVAGYRAAYPDIVTANINPVFHYVNYGAAENRDPSGQFDTQTYRSINGLSAGTNPLYHYLTTGYSQGLSPQGDGKFRFGV